MKSGKIHLLLIVWMIVLLSPRAMLLSQQQKELSKTANLDSIEAFLVRTYEAAPEALFKTFGRPLAADTTSFRNRHNHDQDFIYKYRFQRAIVSIYHATGIQRYLLGGLEITNVRDLSHLGLFSSMSPEALRQLLGQESSQVKLTPADMELTYQVGEELANEISFIFHRNKLRSIRYEPYLD